jgi:hypothetical protein
MAVQIYLIQPKNNEDDNAREEIAAFIAQRNGFILMATSYGSLIAAFDDGLIETIRHHHQVEFASGVTLNPNAPGAEALKQMFVQNMAMQIQERQANKAAGQSSSSSTADHSFPPGYRPLRWDIRTYDTHDEGGE